MVIIGPFVAICFVSGMVSGSLYSTMFGAQVVKGLRSQFDWTLEGCTGDVNKDLAVCWSQ